MKALGLVVSEKKIFLYFHHDAPGAGPVWTTGARLVGFIKRITIYCYKQNMKALGLVISSLQSYVQPKTLPDLYFTQEWCYKKTWFRKLDISSRKSRMQQRMLIVYKK